MTLNISNEQFDFTSLESRFNRRVTKEVAGVEEAVVQPEKLEEDHREKVQKFDEILTTLSENKVPIVLKLEKIQKNEEKIDKAIKKSEKAHTQLIKKHNIHIEENKKAYNIINNLYASSINNNYNKFVNLDNTLSKLDNDTIKFHGNHAHKKAKAQKKIQEMRKLIKKELLTEIDISRKLLTKNIVNLENSVKDCTLFNMFPSIFENGFIIKLFKSIYGDKINAVCNVVNIRNQIKFINKIEYSVQKRNKQDIIDTIDAQGTIRLSDPDYRKKLNNKSITLNDDCIKTLKNVLDSTYSKKENGLIRLNNNIDLIFTNKDNYYLVNKSHLIGSGGSKKVYKGLDLSRNKPIAISYVSNSDNLINKKNNIIENAIEEENLYIKLKKNSKLKEAKLIVKIKDYFHSESVGIFVSDLYKCDLEKYLKENNGFANRKEKNDAIKNIIDIVRHSVKEGFFINDLKPGNILIDNDFNLALCDFDIKSFTLDYCAPEIVFSHLKKTPLDSNPDNEKSVVWSLGMTLFEVCYGKKFLNLLYSNINFNGEDGKNKKIEAVIYLTDDLINTFFQNKKGNVKSNEEGWVLDFIHSMLQVDPNNRPNLDKIKNEWKRISKYQDQWASADNSTNDLLSTYEKYDANHSDLPIL
jgi:hypothetical protein